MKATIFFTCLALGMNNANAQIIKTKDIVKSKAENRANNKVDNTVDKGLDKIENGIGNIFKKKEKKQKAADADNSATGEQTGGNISSAANSSVSGTKTASLSVYSKFDFVPGEKILAYEDFSGVAVGDFPTGWNTNSTAEVVKIDGSPANWLFMSKDGYFQPEAVKDLPVNFTLEFDVFTRYTSNNILNYQLFFIPSANPRKDISEEYPKNYIQFRWIANEGSARYYVVENGETVSQNENLMVNDLAAKDVATKLEPVFARISIWRQNSRLRLYVNENKVLDLPQAFDPKQKFNMFKFGTQYMNFSTNDNKDEFMVSNLRYAVGAPDTRSKLMTEGKLVTTGILFKVNESSILPNSYGTLKEIAVVLKDNPSVKVNIVGHTDSDGDPTANLTLSKARAQAVKEALVKDFGIDESRMQTDGKGAATPVASNNTSVGKASNRRVEIIKM